MTTDNRKHLESVASEEMQRLFKSVTNTEAFHAGDWIDLDFYRRHSEKETVMAAV